MSKLQEARELAEKYRNLYAKAYAKLWGEWDDASHSEVVAKEISTSIGNALPWESTK